MTEARGRVRLITFMGRDPMTVRYTLGGRARGTEPQATRGRFSGVALYSLLGQTGDPRKPDEVIVLATKTATEECAKRFESDIKTTASWTDETQLCFSDGLLSGASVKYLPQDFETREDGTDPLWETFQILRNFLDVTNETDPENRPDTIILDITHGFRVTPFIAAATLVHQRMLDALRYERMKTEKEVKGEAPDPPRPPRYMVYAAPDPDPDRVTVIHDISGFVDMLAWTDSLGLFLRGGRLPDVAGTSFPPLPGMEKAQTQPIDSFLSELANVEADMLTMRTGDLLTGTLSHANGQPGSAARAHEALENARKDIHAHAPPVDSVLGELEWMLKPLVLNENAVRNGLGQGAGLDAMRALSARYLQVGRYLEALTMAVEGWTGMMATKEEVFATDPNSPGFLSRQTGSDSKGADIRRIVLGPRFDRYAEKTKDRGPVGDVLQYKRVRNELNHGGYTKLKKGESPETSSKVDASDMRSRFYKSVCAFFRHEIDQATLNSVNGSSSPGRQGP